MASSDHGQYVQMKTVILIAVVFLRSVNCDDSQCARNDYSRTVECLPQSLQEVHASQAQLSDTTSQLSTEFGEMRNEVESLRGELDRLAKIETKVHDLVKEKDEIERRLGNSEKKSAELGDQFDKQEGFMKDVGRELSELKDRMEIAEPRLEIKIDKYVEEQRENIKNVHMKIEENYRSIQSFTKEVDVLKESVIRGHSQMVTIQTELDELKNSFSQQLKNTEVELGSKMQGMADTGKEQVESVEKSLREEIHMQRNVAKQLEEELNIERRRVSETQNVLDAVKNSFSKQLKNTEMELCSKMQDMADTGKEQVESVEKSLREEIHTQRNLAKHLEEELNIERLRVSETQNGLDAVKNSFSQQLKSTEKELGSKIQDVTDASERLVQTAEAELQKRIQVQQDKVNIIYPNTFNKESVSLAGVVMVLWLLVLTVVFLWGQGWGQSAAGRELAVPGSQAVEAEESQVRNMQNNVLVVSYDVSLGTQYRDMVNSVCADASVTVFSIQHEQHVANMPSSKVCIMFVEYSERHVIIETPGLGLGSLKRKTAEAARRNGSCLVIVYVRDPGSRSLRSHQRYNEGISCVTSQPELSVLDDVGQFFSIYSEFTEFQKNCLRNIICKKLSW